MRLDRLYRMMHHLRTGKLGHQIFNFNCINRNDDAYSDTGNKCGTLGCAMGELPIVDSKNWRFSGDFVILKGFGRSDLKKQVATYYQIDENEVYHLFFPYRQNTRLYGGKELNVNATKEQVANNIQAFIDKKLSDEAALAGR